MGRRADEAEQAVGRCEDWSLDGGSAVGARNCLRWAQGRRKAATARAAAQELGCADSQSALRRARSRSAVVAINERLGFGLAGRVRVEQGDGVAGGSAELADGTRADPSTQPRAGARCQTPDHGRPAPAIMQRDMSLKRSRVDIPWVA
jgi:hypothetical protein